MKTINFNSLDEFSKFIDEVAAKYATIELAALTFIGKTLEDDAKRKFGVYQEADGPYEAWEPLAESTQAQRTAQGYSPDDPLYRTGDLMHSISNTVTPHSVTVGSTSEIMVWQEKGVDENNLPPRPVLGPAMFEGQLMIRQVIWEMYRCWLLNEKPHFSKSIFFPIKL